MGRILETSPQELIEFIISKTNKLISNRLNVLFHLVILIAFVCLHINHVIGLETKVNQMNKESFSKERLS